MSRGIIPDWSDMPEGMTLATLSWEDVFIKAQEELQRDPTREETLEMFDDMAHSMKHAVQDDMPSQLDALISEIVTECLKSSPYNQDALTDEQLTWKKYCHECHEIQETYWELNFCDKNPDGIDIDTPYHGNDDMCEDDYCNPDSVPVDDEKITKQYVKEHAVFERCVQCHQYFDSAGPQKDVPKKDLIPCPHGVLDVNECLICEKQSVCDNCNGTGIFDTCAECGGPGCAYCEKNECQRILPGKDCAMCNGSGRFDGTQTLCIGDRQIAVSINSTTGQKLTQQTKADVAEAFLNSNIADWEIDGEKIHDKYTITVDDNIAMAQTDEDHIIASITADGKDCGCLLVYGFKEQ